MFIRAYFLSYAKLIKKGEFYFCESKMNRLIPEAQINIDGLSQMRMAAQGGCSGIGIKHYKPTIQI